MKGEEIFMNDTVRVLKWLTCKGYYHCFLFLGPLIYVYESLHIMSAHALELNTIVTDYPVFQALITMLAKSLFIVGSLLCT